MSDNRCTLSVKFDPENRHTCNKLREFVLRSYRIETEQFDSLLAKGTFVIRNMDPGLARRWARFCESAGAVCRTCMQNPPKDTFQENNAAPPQDAAAVLSCPQCGKLQHAPSNECRYCGIIFHKARPRATDTATAPVAPDESLRRWSLKHAAEWVRGQVIGRIWRREAPIVSHLSHWNKKVGDVLAGCAVVLAIAWILEIGLLFLCKMLWGVYTHTVIGQHYIIHFPLEADAIKAVVGADTLLLAAQVVFAAFLTVLLIGGIGRLFYIVRYFFEPFGIVGKALFWYGPVAALTAAVISRSGLTSLFPLALMLVLVPTACILSRSIRLVQLIIPEFGDIFTFFNWAIRGRTDWMRYFKQFFLKWFG